MNVRMHISMHACMNVCTYVCMHACTYACTYVYVCMCVCMYMCSYNYMTDSAKTLHVHVFYTALQNSCKVLIRSSFEFFVLKQR